MTELCLPWPPSACSPNARGHWSKRARAAKAYRKTCWALAKQAGLQADWEGEVALWLAFFPPDRRHRDDDNIIASFKAGRDGIADAMGIDDTRFRSHPWVSDTPIKGGAVRVRLTPGPVCPD